MQNLDPRTPVLVGIGIVEQKEKDPARAREAIELMSDAVRAAGADAGTATLLAGAERIYVPQGMWGYADPARMIARAIGARDQFLAAHLQGFLDTGGTNHRSITLNRCWKWFWKRREAHWVISETIKKPTKPTFKMQFIPGAGLLLSLIPI